MSDDQLYNIITNDIEENTLVDNMLKNVDQDKLRSLLKVKWVKYIPHEPTIKQLAFLWLMCRDAFYGGAAGGGKSDALLMAALQFIDVPGYNALLLRDTYNNLNKPEGLLTRAHEWLGQWRNEIRWNNESKTFHFIKYGSTLGFGYLDGPRDHFNFLSAAYQFVGIDEVVGIRKFQALYLFSRLRKIKGMEVPIRFRCASNPPSLENLARGEWVKDRYVTKKARQGTGRVFISAKMTDNPHLDTKDYKQSLENLDPITRKQLEDGDWDITVADRFFEIENIEVVDTVPEGRATDIVRRWDLAATEPAAKQKRKEEDTGPAFTCGVKGFIVDGILYVMDVRRKQLLPGPGDQFIVNTAKGDGIKVRIVAEQEPGSSGKRDMWHLSNLLLGFSFVGQTSTGSKIVRARPLSSAITMGRVKFLNAPWNKAAFKELMLFPDGKFKDIVDSMSGMYNDLTGAGSGVGLLAPENKIESQHTEIDNIYG